MVGFVRTRGSLLPDFRSVWNIVELSNIILFVASAIMYVMYIAATGRQSLDVSNTVTYSYRLEGYAFAATELYNLSAINILLSTFRTFKYLRLNDRLYVLWKALDRAGTDLGGFLFLFLIMALGFLLTGLITFGPDTNTFNTFDNAFGTCWMFLIGNPPDYGTLFLSNRILGPLYIALFTIFMFFVLVNMFVAILNDAYGDVNKKTVAPLGVGKAIKANVRRAVKTIRTLARGKKPVTELDILGRLKKPEILERPVVSIEDLKEAIGEGASQEDAEALMDVHRKVHGLAADDEEGDDVTDFRNSGVITSSGGLEMSAMSKGEAVEEVALLRREVQELNEKLDRILELVAVKGKG